MATEERSRNKRGFERARQTGGVAKQYMQEWEGGVLEKRPVW
jgi:hypothetical protein